MVIEVTLNNGVEMPILGFGVFQIPEESDCIAAVEAALEVGYRHIDTAASYRNEVAVGKAIANSGIDRKDLFITTKVWIDSAGEEGALRSFEKSCENLGTEYLDLFLIHQPFGDIYGSWRAMEKLNRDGRARAIGVSNFYADRLVDLIVHNEIVPAVNQIETHPFFSRADYQPLMIEHGVQIESWGPFAEGKNDLFTNPVLAKVGAKHGKSIAQVVLRWLIQRDVVVIPKSIRPDRMAENFDVLNFEGESRDMQRIAGLDTVGSLIVHQATPEIAERLGTYKIEH